MRPTHRVRARGFTLIEIMTAVALIGLLAALAMPQFLSMRSRSQDAAVLNNARQLAAAASQYFMETGSSVANFDQLTGTANYLKGFSPLAGETYPVHFTQGQPIIVSNVGGSRTHSYAP